MGLVRWIRISKAKTKSICIQKGAREASMSFKDRSIFHNMAIGSEMEETVLCYFIDDKLYNITFLFCPENETYQDFIKLFKKTESILIQKYGKPISSERIYEGKYKAGDGNDQMTLIRNGFLRLEEYWINSDNLNEVQLGIGHVIVGLDQPYVYLSYGDGELSQKALIEEENKNKIEF